MRTLRAFALSMLVALPAAAQVGNEPTNLQITCNSSGFLTNPYNCNFLTNPQPLFRWSVPSAYNTYQIQVDSSSSFGGCPWFHDRVASGSTTPFTYTYPSAQDGSQNGDCNSGDALIGQTMFAGLRRHHWRVRVSNDGGSTWSNWVVGQFSTNTFPTMSEPLSVTSGSGGSFVENYGTTTRNAVKSATPATIASVISGAVLGDTIELATGSYSGLTISGKNGTKGQPYILRAASGATPTFTGTLNLSSSFWTIQGLTLSSTSGASLVYSASNLIVRGCTITGNGTTNNGSDYGAILIGGNPSNYFVSNTFNVPSTFQNSTLAPATFALSPSVDKMIRNNDMQSANNDRVIRKAGTETTMGGNMIVADNYFHDYLACSGGSNCGIAIHTYYGSGDQAYLRNYVVNITGSTGYYTQQLRGSWGTWRNNTFGRSGGGNLYCHSFSDPDGQIVVQNESCQSTSIAYDFGSGIHDWQQQHKTVISNSHYTTTSGGTPDWSNDPGTCLTDGTGCFTITSTTRGGSANLTAAGRPQSSSTLLINLGGTAFPVPVDGAGDTGTRVDIGRYEFNAPTITDAATYDYNPIATGINATPRISWTFVDGDNSIHGAGQSQSAYEVQVDTLTTFDSLGDWKPLCSSGVVASAAAFWDVPLSCGLSNGNKYYFRVRTWDNVSAASSSNAGMWSDYINSFTVVGGAAYYVAPSGGSDSNPGTQALPWATAQKAVNTAVAGDTVYFRGGTHTVTSFQWSHGSTGSSGTAINPITFRNFPGETPILNLAGTANAHGGVGVDVHANYITFDGLRFTGAPAEGLDVWGQTGVVIRNCEFYDNSTNGAVSAQNNLQFGDSGVGNHATGGIIDSNKFYFTPSKGYPSSHSVYMIASNTRFTNNIIQDTETQTSGAYGLQIGTTGESDTDLLIAHNTIVRTGSRAGIVIQGSTITNLTIQNNIVRDANYIADSNTGCIRLVSGTTFTNAIVRNNNLMNCGTGGTVRNESASSITQSGNTTSDPLFTNYAGGDYHLTSGSPAINVGTSLGTQILTDKDGDVRPTGSGFDIGMDEFTGIEQVCGNNTRENPEICDGTDLNSQTCITQGFAGGTLACSSDCLSFNTTSCTIATPVTGTIRGMTRSGSTKR